MAPPEVLEKAVMAGDVGYLTKASGIGRKTGEKIIMELKDKIGSLDRPELQAALAQESDTLDALQALGYSQRESREALKLIPEHITDPGERIKAALKHLNK
ncbi:MAG TPA: helix-hairpin-helix domain-containing protein, partial [Candidatus Paceibacterota bacterium]|nr:helix-hairpin-helix domain-containing protein [Candidatus Paceibacterota bacterium]